MDDEAMEMEPDAEAPEGESPEGVDPRMMEVFQLTLARVREALANVGPDLDAALKADPVAGAVQFGTSAVREVVMAAQKAGRSLPFEVIVAVGVATVKDLAEIANDKGYLPDEQIEVMLKESFQQSLARYVELDAKDGLISDGDMQAVRGKLSAKPAGPGVLAQEAMA